MRPLRLKSFSTPVLVGFLHHFQQFTNCVLKLHKPGQNCFYIWLAFHNNILYLTLNFAFYNKTIKFSQRIMVFLTPSRGAPRH